MAEEQKANETKLNHILTTNEEQKKVEVQHIEKAKPAEKTECWLKSRANYIIELKENGKTKFIQPFGKIKVVREDIKLASNADANYLTFIKI